MEVESNFNIEVWDLKYSISEFIVPRLIEFKLRYERHENKSIPKWVNTDPDLSKEELDLEWAGILGQILIPFEYHIKPEKYEIFSHSEIESLITDGLKLFSEFFIHLWD